MARLFTSLIYPPDPHIGFLIGNISLALIGLGGYVFVVRRERPSAMAWIVLEASNGVGHIGWAGTVSGIQWKRCDQVWV